MLSLLWLWALLSISTTSIAMVDDTFSLADSGLSKVRVPYHNTKKEPMVFDLGNVKGKFAVKYKPETFYAKNANMLNNAVRSDVIFYQRSTLDFNLDLTYGEKCYGYDVLEFYSSMRNKYVWGNPESILVTTVKPVKLLDTVTGEHTHSITRLPMWLREFWVLFSVNEALDLPFNHVHTAQLGLFPFELGRGIALGSAYAVNPGSLGFYSDNSIDQFAPGLKVSGNVISDYLFYDLYAAILENLADSFRNTSEKVYGQQFGRRLDQERGPGKVNFVFASRLRWTPVRDDCKEVYVEPYIMYNKVPEQRIEFRGDASAKLATFGVSTDFRYNNFEFGIESALNRGQQHVKGWDRNIIKFQNNQGYVTEVNSQAYTLEGIAPHQKQVLVLHVPGSETQKLINTTVENELQNGKPIGVVDGVTIYNGDHRFNNPYNNKLLGWMVVADLTYSLHNGDVKISTETGAASGDENPNLDLDNPGDSNIDGDYKGFIGLQEIYAGRKVKSVFLLGGAGRAPRPLTTPARSVVNAIPSVVSSFNNLVYLGASVQWQPSNWDRNFFIKPNLIAYWQQFATKKFDAILNKTLNEKASNYLGFEANVFTDVALLKDLRFFFVGSVFVPGTHYKDIKGKPLTAEQQRILDRADRTGVGIDNLPLLGDDIAYTLNCGLELKF